MLKWFFPRDAQRDAGLDSILAEHAVHLIFKHSPLCVVSALAREQVEQFSRAFTWLPVNVVDVIRQRPLSEGIAARTGVRHASSQVLLLQEGGTRRITESPRPPRATP